MSRADVFLARSGSVIDLLKPIPPFMVVPFDEDGSFVEPGAVPSVRVSEVCPAFEAVEGRRQRREGAKQPHDYLRPCAMVNGAQRLEGCRS